MTCFHPRKAWQRLGPDGKKVLSFREYPPNPFKYKWEKIQVPCRQCKGCRYDRAVSIGIRSFHESQAYNHNCFITLTVAPKWIETVFPDGSLRKEPFVLFAKRLRKFISQSKDPEVISMITCIDKPVWYNRGKWNRDLIRFLWCAEYGDKNKRPHYHACVYNFDFPDKKKAEMRNGIQYYSSKILDSLWSDPETKESYGMARIGELNMASSVYLGKYCSKRINFSPKKLERAFDGMLNDKDKKTFDIYCDRYFHPDTGVILNPEFVVFPRGFGLGRMFYEKHKSDFYHPIEEDSCVHILRNGKAQSYKVPEYYDKLYSVQDPSGFERVKNGRVERARAHSQDNTPERLAVREELFNSRCRDKERNVYNET